MANSILVLSARRSYQFLLSIKQLTGPKLLLWIPPAILLSLASPGLLNSLRVCLLYRRSILSPVPVFLVSNFLVLAIVLSSSSSTFQFFVFRSPASTNCDASVRYFSPSELPVQVLSRRKLGLGTPKLKRNDDLPRCSQQPPSSRDVSFSECRGGTVDKAVPVSSRSWPSGFPFAFSRPKFEEVLPAILKTIAATIFKTETKKNLATVEGDANEQRENQFAVMENSTENNSAAASNSSRMARTKPHERRLDNIAVSTKTLRGTMAMGDASIAFRQCYDNKSLMTETELPPIESLSDEEANKRFADFIEKGRATMTKATLE